MSQASAGNQPSPPAHGAGALRLTASGLACRRGGRAVLSGIGFTLAAGEAMAVTGPNGAGKSTLLRLVAGLLRAEAGRLELAGGDPEREIGEQAHYLGHLDAARPAMTVAENLGFWRAMLGGRGDAAGALAAVGLDRLAGFPAAILSAGQRRRLALARLVCVERPLWLLDEPTAALDAAGQALLVSLLDAHRARGGLALVATHAGIAGIARRLDLAPAP